MSCISTLTVQVISVWPGSFGGAIFSSRDNDSGKLYLCIVSFNIIHHAPKTGEFWEIEGRLVKRKKNKDLSFQKIKSEIHCSHAKNILLPSENYISSLLANHHAFRGFSFGLSKIKKLMSEIGAYELVKILNDGNSDLLSEVINPDIAEIIINVWSSLKNEVETINFLIENNFDGTLQRKIISLCKTNTVERLKNNPYSLVCFGQLTKYIWLTIERCAKNLGIDKESSLRLAGGIEHSLYERLNSGHTVTSIPLLIELSSKVLGSESRALEGLKIASNAKSICFVEIDDENHVQLLGPAIIESQLEKRINSIVQASNDSSQQPYNSNNIISSIKDYHLAFKNNNGYSLTELQLDSIVISLTLRCSILTGYAGSGKTTVLSSITELADDFMRPYFMLAYTGKAVDRIRKATGRESYTIHSFIKQLKGKNAEDILASDPLIIIDESSMVSPSLLNQLLSFFDGRSYSLLTLGDPAQLSPTSWGLAWHKMVKSNLISKIHLNSVHRTESESLHDAAMLIRKGVEPSIPDFDFETNEKQSGIYFVETDKKNFRSTVSRIKNKLNSCQVLTPHTTIRLPDSATTLNIYLQKYTAHTIDDIDKYIKMASFTIMINDPVIVTQNNYELELFNGTMGVMVDIDITDGELKGVFLFEGHDQKMILSKNQLYEIGIQLGYAISIHKSQGSEYPAIVISCIVDSFFVERSMIYTALTRAKDLCIIVGTRSIFNKAIKKQPRAETLQVGLYLDK